MLPTKRGPAPPRRGGRPAAFALLTALSLVLSLAFSLVASEKRADAGEPIGVLYSGLPAPEPREVPAPEPCTESCFLLSSLVLKGRVDAGLAFELRGVVRAREEVKVPLFGPPGQVRLDDVTLDGAPAEIAFDGDSYFVFTKARAFTVRGKITLGSDQLLSVPGPIVTVDARLSKGRLVEGERLSGVSGAVLHFDPEEGEASERARARVATVFRLSRAIRIGRETSFVYRLVVSQGTDLGTIRLPLRYGEKVGDAQGAEGFSVDGTDLLLRTSGHEAEITISGTMPDVAGKGVRTFTPDERSSYEWWLVEADPEHRVAAGGEAKLVETSQSPIPATMPGARVFLVQKGQALEVDARSLVRGDVLAAVVRDHRRFVAITGRGELISDESIAYDNNGLDHLMVTPAGKAMYLSTDGTAQRILHTEAGAKDVLVPVRTGSHRLRVQSLSEVRLWPIAGAVAIPPTTYPIATSAAETVIGVPEHVRPIAILGGDRVRWALSRGDLFAAVLGAAVACFAFRERRTRAIGALATAGLWFVSREAFVVAAASLFAVGAVFLASRFLRGSRLLVAAGVVAVAALLGGRAALASDATAEPEREMFASSPDLPRPESAAGSSSLHGDPGADITPVSLSFPTSERYVQASRQLVTNERPFVPRLVYVTSTFTAALHVVWLALVALLVWAHREAIATLKRRIAERLTRRPDPTTAPEAPPF